MRKVAGRIKYTPTLPDKTLLATHLSFSSKIKIQWNTKITHNNIQQISSSIYVFPSFYSLHFIVADKIAIAWFLKQNFDGYSFSWDVLLSFIVTVHLESINSY